MPSRAMDGSLPVSVRAAGSPGAKGKGRRCCNLKERRCCNKLYVELYVGWILAGREKT